MVLAWGELARRVVRVEAGDGDGDGDGRPGQVLGTGFFVAPGWVLTCAHVVGAAGFVQLRADRSVAPSPLPGRVAAASAAPASGGGLWPFPDLALIELVAPVPDHSVVWLDESGPAGGREVSAWGFAPRSQGEDPVGAAASFGFEGTDGDGFLRLKAGQAARGLSGSPVVCPVRRAVVGVVAASRNVESDLGGWASPVAGLLYTGPGAAEDLALLGAQVLAENRRAVLADRGAWHVVLPVGTESGVVPERVWEGRFTRSRRALPSDLLLADFGLVPFLFRDAEVAEAIEWCQSPEPVGLAQVAGRGGAGKTRFAIEVCKAMEARGWLAGFWRTGSGPVTAPVPRLLVVDYAEAEDPTALREGLLAARNSGTPIAPVRILLLTRTRAGGSGDALDGLYELAPANLRGILDSSVDSGAAQHILSLDQRRDLFLQARNRFADAWHEDRRSGLDGPPSVLAQERYGLPLEVLYEALDHVLAEELDHPADASAAPVDRVLAHEQRHWNRTLAQVPGMDAEMAGSAVALATLAGAADRHQAHGLLALLPALADSAAEPFREKVIDWLAGLYDGPRLLNPLRPDRLGEQLIIRVLRRARDGGTSLLSAALALPDDGQVTQVLEVLARICAADPGTARITAQALASTRELLTERAEAQATLTADGRISRALATALARLLLGPLADLSTDPTIVPGATRSTYRYALSVDYAGLGDLAQDAGQVDQARDLFTRMRDINLALLEQYPDNPLFRYALSAIYQRLGDLARDAGQVDQARELHTRKQDIALALAEQYPDNLTYRYSLSTAYQQLGDLARDAGQVEQARELYTRKQDIDLALVEQDPDNPTYRYALGVDYERLGDLARDARQVEQARDLYTRARDIALALAEQDPDNPTYRYALTAEYLRLGDLARDAGHIDQARELYTRMQDIHLALVEQDPENPTYRHALGVDYERMGDLARDAGQVEQARDLYTREQDIHLALVEQDPDNPTYRHALDLANGRLSDLA